MIKRNGGVHMIMTVEWANILDEADQLSAMILSSQPAKNLQDARHDVYSDESLVKEIKAFNKMKEQYEEVQRFGKYHPDYQSVMKKIREMKRNLDINEKIVRLKLAENDFQEMLDEVSIIIGKSVSEAVKVPVNGPLSSSSSCGCSTGGSCGCLV